jgi:hypothetical protein
MAGNPLADLAWFRGDDKIADTVTVKGGEAGDFSRSDLTIVANRTDNGRTYRCEASNAATAEPKKTFFEVAVQFKPAHVKIKVRLPLHLAHTNFHSTVHRT